jgi:hypothetical protein
MTRVYRPWGMLHWVLAHCPKLQWSLLGCLSTEERCLAAWTMARNEGVLSSVYLAEIIDPPSRFQALTDERLKDRRDTFLNQGGNIADIRRHDLFARAGEIIQLVEDMIANSSGNIILDMSSLPKRFFFPSCRLLLQNPAVKNLIATYATPVRYSHSPLAEDFQEWRALPLFTGSTDTPEILIVNVGHLAMGLPDQIEHGSPRMEVKLLFPFPNAPESYQLTRQFLRSVEQNLRGAATQIKHVNGMDVSDSFDHICSLSEQGSKRVLFAPYGPKPTSLAMCIYATLKESPVFYTQPRAYNPDYSHGIKSVKGINQIYAYCLKLDGHNFYSIP